MSGAGASAPSWSCAAKREHGLQRVDCGGAQRRTVPVAIHLGQLDDLGARERILGQPALDPNSRRADDGQCEPVFGQLCELHDVRERPDAEPDVAATDLAPPLDQHDAELLIAVEHMTREGAVAGLEHVERHDGVREKNGPEREHRQVARHDPPQFNRARNARASPRRRGAASPGTSSATASSASAAFVMSPS